MAGAATSAVGNRSASCRTTLLQRVEEILHTLPRFCRIRYIGRCNDDGGVNHSIVHRQRGIYIYMGMLEEKGVHAKMKVLARPPQEQLDRRTGKSVSCESR
jgi:hypothetical protein